MNHGDTAWVLLSAALVLLMTPGLALFYGGLARSKNAAATIMHSLMSMGIVGVVWVLWGYSLAFGPDVGKLIGDFSFVGLNNVSAVTAGPYADNIPHQAFMIFQGMFAIIAVALITGGFAERMKFSSYVLFSVLWVSIVYVPVAHWVWGGGLDRRAWRTRLCRRKRGPHQHRGGRPRGGDGPRQTHRLRLRAYGAAQHTDGRHRRRSPVVRLVRIQRRLGLGSGRSRGQCLRGYKRFRRRRGSSAGPPRPGFSTKNPQ